MYISPNIYVTFMLDINKLGKILTKLNIKMLHIDIFQKI